jgi:hypothetical protein
MLGDPASRVSRRELLRDGAIVAGGAAAIGMLDVGSAHARPGRAPRPIPGGLDHTFKPVPRGAFIHVLPPGIGFEMSTITDFDGVLGGSEIRGTARGSDGATYDFDTDMRFMHGVYVGLDGRKHHGTFGFV